MRERRERGKQRTQIEDSWARTMRGGWTVEVGELDRNEQWEKGGTMVTKQ